MKQLTLYIDLKNAIVPHLQKHPYALMLSIMLESTNQPPNISQSSLCTWQDIPSNYHGLSTDTFDYLVLHSPAYKLRKIYRVTFMGWAQWLLTIWCYPVQLIY